MNNLYGKSLGLLIIALIMLVGASGPLSGQVIPVVFRGVFNQTLALAGGVSPDDAHGFPVTLSQAGLYILEGTLITENEFQHAIEITAEGVWLSCDDGTSIIGRRGPATQADRVAFRATMNSLAGFGIVLSGARLVTVEDCLVTNFWDGILVRGGEKNVLRRNTVQNNLDDGFQIENSNDNFFIQNTVGCSGAGCQNTAECPGAGCPNLDDGFDVELSHRNHFIANIVNRNGNNGFALDDSNDNVLTQNTSNRNGSRGISMDGGIAPMFNSDLSVGNLIISNTANSNGGNNTSGNGIRIRGGSNIVVMNNSACGRVPTNVVVEVINAQRPSLLILANNSFCSPPLIH